MSLDSLLTSNEETPYSGKEHQPSLCIRAQSRSHFSRAARTCSGSTISGFELKWPASDRTQGNVARWGASLGPDTERAAR